jgi:hypothetical protein
VGAPKRFPDELIVGDISSNALAAEISSAAAKSAIRHLKRASDGMALVPSHESLRVGDIILSRPVDRKWPTSEIESTQRRYGCIEEHCTWTHAMLYVGQLHVAESNKPYALKTGVAIFPLTAYTAGFEFLVLRYKNDEFLAGRRQNIARYGLLSPNINPRKYDRKAVWDAWRRKRPGGAQHTYSINCSEFILECFAIAGPYMIEDYLKVVNEKDTFYFPAHFAADPLFEQVPMKYYRFVTSADTAKPTDASPS